jgi:ABC-type cobalamin/Fe3+-siderophores transport system ATPase subunit
MLVARQHVAGTPKEVITSEMLGAVYGVRARVTQDMENVLNIDAINTPGAAGDWNECVHTLFLNPGCLLA